MSGTTWTRAAALDLLRIARPAGGGPRSDLSPLRRRLEGLARGAGGRPVPELAALGVRRWLEVRAAPWRVIYREDGAERIVLAVLDLRRDPLDQLFERLVSERAPGAATPPPGEGPAR